MVTEIKDLNLPSDQGQIELEEHSRYSKAKKVIPGSFYFVREDNRTAVPIDLKTTPLVGNNKAFRVISDADFYFNLSQGGVIAAATTDIFVPAKTEVLIATREFDYINVTGTGFIQGAEVK